MSSTLTPSMNLILPGVGTEAGPTYAFDTNNSLTLIDQHDHSPGKGVQITTSGININSDLSLNGFSLTNALTIVLTSESSASTTPQSLSVAPGGESPQQQDLWYTPDTGVPIQITKNGAVNVVASSIPGESYAAGTFFWTQEQDGFPTTPANFDIGSIVLRPNVASTTFGVELHPASGITSQYGINLPLIPVTKSILTLDTSGNMVADTTVDNSTIEIAGNIIQVKNQGITAAKILNNTITTNQISLTAGITGSQLASNAGILGTQIADQTITQNNLADRTVDASAPIGGIALSSTSATFSNVTTSYVPKTATQTPVTITIASPAVITVTSTSGYFQGMPVKFTGGTLPTGLTLNTYYYIVGTISATQFNVAATPGGTAINTSGTQSGTHTITAITFSANITTTGRPVMITLVPDGVNPANAGFDSTTATPGVVMSFSILRNVTTTISEATFEFGTGAPVLVPPGCISMMDNVAAGNYTYHIEIKTSVINRPAENQ